MNNLPLVSIVAICYNHAEYLEKALDSIVNQSYPNIQLIILDDCSSDNSVELIRKWITKKQIDCLFIPHEKNRGLCGTLNHGLTYIKGTYYQYFACDDIMMPEKIAKQVKVLEENPTVALVHSNGYKINEKDEIIGDKIHAKPLFVGKSNIVFKQLLSENRISAPAILIRASMLPPAPVYNESLVFEDWDLWLQLAEKYDFDYIDEPLIQYRILSTSMIRTPVIRKKVGEDAIKILSRYLGLNKEYDSIIQTSILNLREKYDLYEYSFKAFWSGQTPLRKLKDKLRIRTRIKNFFVRS